VLTALVTNAKLSSEYKTGSLAALSRGTTDEKAHATLQLIDSIRNISYAQVEKDPPADTHYNLWASGFGDGARNHVGGYKTTYEMFGFVAGVNTHINDAWSVGLSGGYGKLKTKYRTDVKALSDKMDSHCNQKSYFGGVYSVWENLFTDLNIKASFFTGHTEHDETLVFPNLLDDSFAAMQADGSHDGYWLSGNIDCTYKHWNVAGMNVGPWVSLSIANVHQKSKKDMIGSGKTTDATPLDYKIYRTTKEADRRAVELTVGAAADYDLGLGNFELALGYKRDFRRLKGGEASLSTQKGTTESIDSNDVFAPLNIKSGQNSFVAKASWNANFGNLGLSLGIHGKVGDHFNDIAGSVTASYSF
jgi:hypothetical protein